MRKHCIKPFFSFVHKIRWMMEIIAVDLNATIQAGTNKYS